MTRKSLNKLVLKMSSHLKPISDKEKGYAKSIFPSSGYYKQNGEVWCHCCGNIEYHTRYIGSGFRVRISM
jgi:hypothetical protein|nr:MAG TPA: Protein of unknown function (DUF3725) [Caudoviricetes sp.]